MNRVVAYVRKLWKQFLLLGIAVGSFLAAEFLISRYYYSQSYSHYAVGQVYWEDSNTELFFSPDRHLFWRYKPNIKIELANPIEEYNLYTVGTRTVPHQITVETNSRGLRAPEFECEKPPNTFRIFTLGDSRTMAEGVHAGERYSNRLEDLLNARGDGRNYEVINAATDGYSSYQGRHLLARELLECDPDAVTLLFGINDQDWDQNVRDVDKAEVFDNPLVSFSQWANRSMLVYFTRRQIRQVQGRLFGKTERRPTYQTESEGRTRRVPLSDYDANLNAIIDLGKENDFLPILIIVPSSPYAHYSELFLDTPSRIPPDDHQILRQAMFDYERGDYTVALDDMTEFIERYPHLSGPRYQLGRIYQQLGRFEDAHREFVRANQQIIFTGYEETVRRVAESRDAPLADLTAEFYEIRREPLYVDDVHPNALGQELIAQQVYDRIAEHLDTSSTANERAEPDDSRQPGSEPH